MPQENSAATEEIVESKELVVIDEQTSAVELTDNINPLIKNIIDAQRAIDCERAESSNLMLQSESAESKAQELQRRAELHQLDVLEKEKLLEQNNLVFEKACRDEALAEQEYDEALQLLEMVKKLIITKEAVLNRVRIDRHESEALRLPLVKSLQESRLEYEKFMGLSEVEKINSLEVLTDIKKRSIAAKLHLVNVQKSALASGDESVIWSLLKDITPISALSFQN